LDSLSALCVTFYRNQIHINNALNSLGWCDTFFVENKAGLNPHATQADSMSLIELDIDYDKYNVCLSFNDSYLPGGAAELHFKNCMERGIPIYSNQHGFDKSVINIKPHTPNRYTYYWNTMGKYWLDRFEYCVGKKPSTRRWISIGSLKNDYLFKNYKHDQNNTNGKILVLHEPDTGPSQKDKDPFVVSHVYQELVELLGTLDVEVDFKIHPSWPNFIGNFGEKLWSPPDWINIVDIDLPEMIEYDVVIGAYSTVLLDAASMGVPVINLNFEYPTGHGSHWGPGELGLFRRTEIEEIPDYIKQIRANGVDYDHELLCYFLGPLGSVAENYAEFILKNHKEPNNKSYLKFNRKTKIILKTQKILGVKYIKQFFKKIYNAIDYYIFNRK